MQMKEKSFKRQVMIVSMQLLRKLTLSTKRHSTCRWGWGMELEIELIQKWSVWQNRISP